MAESNTFSTLLVILITILFPPAGVFIVAGCGADLLINVCLTVLGYFPGHIHAFYLEYVYFERRNRTYQGNLATEPAPGVFSDNIQSGGATKYGTVAH